MGDFGSVMVVDMRGVVGNGVAESFGATGTGGPIFEAGAVGSAAAGSPGVWADANDAAQITSIAATRGRKQDIWRVMFSIFMISLLYLLV